MRPEAYTEMAAQESRHWWFRARRRILASVIRQLKLKPHARILELGSGTGGNLLLLRKFGAVTAIERDETARALAAAKGSGATLLAGSLPDDLPLAPTQTFDLICLLDVLEHVQDDAGTLATLARHLAPGGAGIITVPAHPLLFGPHDRALHHIRRYTRDDFRARLLEAGLRIEKLTYLNFTLAPLAFASRGLDILLRRARPSGTGIPPAGLNTAFETIFGAEAALIPYLALPFGLSLLAVVRQG